jgi:hypothetical protein
MITIFFIFLFFYFFIKVKIIYINYIMNVSTTTTTNPVNMYDYINSLVFNPIVFIVILLIIIGYFVLFSSLGNSSETSIGNIETDADKGQKIIGIIIIAVLVVLIIVNAFQYFLNVNITAYIEDIFSNKPKIDVVVDQSNYQPAPVPTIKFKKQVFNIPGNYYNYDNAKAVCTAYGSKLATYQQIEDSYKNGGEWCNYGWSEGQNALFPTQQKTFDNLQGIKGHEHDCGRPGINGGYIANPQVKFGVNCYGNKPKINKQEEELMKTVSPYPQTKEDLVFQKRVDYWKDKVDEILVSPFNYNSWGQL